MPSLAFPPCYLVAQRPLNILLGRFQPVSSAVSVVDFGLVDRTEKLTAPLLPAFGIDSFEDCTGSKTSQLCLNELQNELNILFSLVFFCFFLFR